MPHLERLRARARGILTENQALWTAFAERRRAARGNGAELDPGVTPLGTTAWSLFPGGGEGDSFSEFAAARFDLAVTPGRFFGDARGLRVGLGSEPPRFAEALEQLERALAAFFSARAGTGAAA
jgi:aspartate/methionine/tyrosine aminotransferase